MTLTINSGYDDLVKVEFVRQSIELYNIKKITTESEIVPNRVNVVTKDNTNCGIVINKIQEITDIEIINENNLNTIIVLWD